MKPRLLPHVMVTLSAAILTLASIAAAQTAAPVSATGGQTRSSLSTPAFAQLVEGRSIVVLTTDGRDFEGVFTISGNALVSRNGEDDDSLRSNRARAEVFA